MIRLISYSILLICLVEGLWAYEIPKPRIEVYKKGFEISIPNRSGITSASFKVTNDDTAKWEADVNQPGKNLRRWVYKSYDAELQVGDTLHYYISVKKDGDDYNTEGVHTVEDYEIDKSLYKIPKPTVKVYKKGFQFSTPNEDGMTFYSFSANLNAEHAEDDVGTFRDQHLYPDANGFWTYTNLNEELQIGDSLNYLLAVAKDGRLYELSDVYTVNSYD